MENNWLKDGVCIDFVLHVYIINKYANMEYNNGHHKLFMNGNILTSNNSSISALTSDSVTSTNDKGCSLFSQIHESIKYLYYSKIQLRAVRSAIDAMQSHIKLLAHKHGILSELNIYWKINILNNFYQQWM